MKDTYEKEIIKSVKELNEVYQKNIRNDNLELKQKLEITALMVDAIVDMLIHYNKEGK